MSSARTGRHPYSHHGVLLTLEDKVHGSRILKEWKIRPGLSGRRKVASNRRTRAHLAEKGFFLVDVIYPGSSRRQMLTVQSKSTNELFVNKIFRWSPEDGDSLNQPNELRVSTCPDIPDDDDDDDDDEQAGAPSGALRARGISTGPRRHGGAVLPEVPYFNKLSFWQEMRPNGNSDKTVFSLFFE